jgi:hypothetical protein
MTRIIQEELTNALLVPKKSPAAQEAASMGLQYVGFGRYEDPRSGQVTHIVQNDKLVPFSRAIRTNTYQTHSADDFGTYLNALSPDLDKDLSELAKVFTPDKYSEEELDAIKKYTDNSYYNVSNILNKLPMGIIGKQIQPANISDDTPKLIEAMDAAMMRNKVPTDVIGYISLSQDIDTNMLGAGRKLGFKSYRSTTLAMNTLLDQYTNSGSGGGVVLQVLIPKGSNGLYADDFSANPGEREFILPRSSSIEILSGPNKLSGTYMSADNNLEVHFFNCKLV